MLLGLLQQCWAGLGHLAKWLLELHQASAPQNVHLFAAAPTCLSPQRAGTHMETANCHGKRHGLGGLANPWEANQQGCLDRGEAHDQRQDAPSGYFLEVEEQQWKDKEKLLKELKKAQDKLELEIKQLNHKLQDEKEKLEFEIMQITESLETALMEKEKILAENRLSSQEVRYFRNDIPTIPIIFLRISEQLIKTIF